MKGKLLNYIVRTVILAALALLIVAAQVLPTGASTSLGPQNLPPQVRLEGYLKAQGVDKWVVGDYSITVDQQTAVIEKRGRAEVGAWLIVWAIDDAMGELRAELIEVDRPAGQPGPTVQFSGILNKQTGEWWVVEDTLIRVTADTIISGNPQVGYLVWVMAEQQGLDLQAIATETIAETPGAVPVEFEGTIESIGTDSWTVNGLRVEITTDTVTIGQPAIGKNAEIKATLATDGSPVAHLIRVQDQPADVTLGAMVATIIPEGTNTEVWDVVIFPNEPWAIPQPTMVHIDGNTLVDESRAIAQPGQWAEMRALPTGQGAYKADAIRVEQPVPVTISGEVNLLPNGPANSGWWQVDGRPVWVSGASIVKAAPQRKGGASVRGLLLGNGVVWARELRVAKSMIR